MLLYDQIIEHCHNTIKRHGRESFTAREYSNLAALMSATVYEVSSCAVLHADWEREKDRPVPRKPPNKITWVEWNSIESGSKGRTDWTVGCGIQEATSEDLKQIESGIRYQFAGASVAERTGGERQTYFCQMFRRRNRDEDENGKRRHKESWNIPAVDYGTFVFTTDENGGDCKANKLCPVLTDDERALPHDEQMRILHCRAGLFQMPIMFSMYEDIHFQVAYPWVPFMAFSLLHCKNIVTEDNPPDERVLRHCKKHGLPPRVTYKTLRVEVPKTTHARRDSVGSGDQASPQVRFHLCSGHFRELRSEKFKNKHGQWVWVTQHFRGSKELGEVHTRREIASLPAMQRKEVKK